MEWGTTPDWIAAIAMALAFGGAPALLRHEQQQRADSVAAERAQQARMVSVWLGREVDEDYGYDAIGEPVETFPAAYIRNASELPIYDVGLYVLQVNDDRPFRTLDVAPPGTTTPRPWKDAEEERGDNLPAMTFLDASGVRGTRAADGRLYRGQGGRRATSGAGWSRRRTSSRARMRSS